MKVRELIEKLQKCNQEAIVCVEVDEDPAAQEVVQYTHFKDGTPDRVYICDDSEDLDEVITTSVKKII